MPLPGDTQVWIVFMGSPKPKFDNAPPSPLFFSLLWLVGLPTLLACATNSPTTLIIQSRTEQGLVTLPKVTAKAPVALLMERGNSATFTHEVLSSSTVSVPTTGRIWVAAQWNRATVRERVEGKR